MITTNIDFPDGLPCALREGYGLQPVQPFTRTKMQSGRARQRRTFTSVPVIAQVSWVMTEGQAMAFEAWFQDAINDGVDWFNCELKTPMGLKPYVCRFTEIYNGPELLGVNSWKISAELELFERPLVPRELRPFPELIIGSSIIDLAINREWPEYMIGGESLDVFYDSANRLHILLHETLPYPYWGTPDGTVPDPVDPVEPPDPVEPEPEPEPVYVEYVATPPYSGWYEFPGTGEQYGIIPDIENQFIATPPYGGWSNFPGVIAA